MLASTRKTWALTALALTLVVLPGPGEAAREYRGSVLLPSSPSLPRQMYTEGYPNGLTGWVIRFDNVVPQGTKYLLVRLSGNQQLVDLDVWFYEDIERPETICPAPPQNPDGRGGEAAHFTCDARWGIVVLFSGIDADFVLHVG